MLLFVPFLVFVSFSLFLFWLELWEWLRLPSWQFRLQRLRSTWSSSLLRSRSRSAWSIIYLFSPYTIYVHHLFLYSFSKTLLLGNMSGQCNAQRSVGWVEWLYASNQSMAMIMFWLSFFHFSYSDVPPLFASCVRVVTKRKVFDHYLSLSIIYWCWRCGDGVTFFT